MTDKLENFQENNQTAYKGTASDDNITITDIDFSGYFVYTFEGNDTVVLENPKNKLEIFDGLGNDSYTLIETSSFDYNLDQDHILELDFKGFLDITSLKFFKLEYNGSNQVLDIDMSSGIVLATYEQIRIAIEDNPNLREFNLVVVDEAQRLKNKSSNIVLTLFELENIFKTLPLSLTVVDSSLIISNVAAISG